MTHLLGSPQGPSFASSPSGTGCRLTGLASASFTATASTFATEPSSVPPLATQAHCPPAANVYLRTDGLGDELVELLALDCRELLL